MRARGRGDDRESSARASPRSRNDLGQLSGGQQQSVAIARALTFNPKLVIMDEPTAALAVREVEHVLDLIRTLKSQGIAVILISHRLTDVFSVCDRIVALRQGTGRRGRRDPGHQHERRRRPYRRRDRRSPQPAQR